MIYLAIIFLEVLWEGSSTVLLSQAINLPSCVCFVLFCFVSGCIEEGGQADLSDKMVMDMIKKDMQARAVSGWLSYAQV